MLGEASINIKELLHDCSLVKKPLGLNKKYFEDVLKKSNQNLKLVFDKEDDSRFWLKMQAKNKKGEIEKNGLVKV